MSDPAARVRAAAGRVGPFGTHLHVCSEVGSTNDVAAALAAEGAPHGTVVVASAQRARRRRHGHEWFSPPGTGLYVSVLLRTVSQPVLTLATGVAVAETLREAGGLVVELKWPNDVVAPCAGGDRKVAGILAEAVTGREPRTQPAPVIIGIGVNLSDGAWPPELAGRAGSIEGLSGRAVDPDHLLVELLAGLARCYAELEGGRLATVLERWTALAPMSRGTRVTWSHGVSRQEGVTEGIDGDGALLVRVGSRVERLSGGEVSQVRRTDRREQ